MCLAEIMYHKDLSLSKGIYEDLMYFIIQHAVSHLKQKEVKS